MNPKDVKKKIMHVMGGTVLTGSFFMKNLRFIVVFVLLVVLYISNRYTAIERMSRIERLQYELKDAKYESVTISARLIGVSREVKIKELVEKNGLDIDFTKEPVYKLKD
jgi:cell division protein FtsL